MLYANAFREHCGIDIDEYGQFVLDLPPWRNREFVDRYPVHERCSVAIRLPDVPSPREERDGGAAGGDGSCCPVVTTDASVNRMINDSAAGGGNGKVSCRDSSTQTDLCDFTSSSCNPCAEPTNSQNSNDSYCSSLWFDSGNARYACGNGLDDPEVEDVIPTAGSAECGSAGEQGVDGRVDDSVPPPPDAAFAGRVSGGQKSELAPEDA